MSEKPGLKTPRFELSDKHHSFGKGDGQGGRAKQKLSSHFPPMARYEVGQDVAKV